MDDAAHEELRYRLQHKLGELVGDEEAAELMASLPPVAWTDLATKTDLAALETRLLGESALQFGIIHKELGLQIASVRHDLGRQIGGEIASVRHHLGLQIGGEIASVRHDLGRQIASVRHDTASLRQEVGDQIGSVRHDLGSLRQEVGSQIASLRQEVGALAAATRGQTFTIIATMIVVMVAMATFVAMYG